MKTKIRSAVIADVKHIHAILGHFAKEGLLLGRSISSIYDKLRDFAVCVDENDQVLGVCALQIIWEDLAEIRSLAVLPDYHGLRIGSRLVAWCLDQADYFGIGKVFALTYQAVFFEKHGFHHISKNELPHKIWSDCINCPMFPDCNEEAMMIDRK
ncbi:MAG: GNAT family N-acetyltransferase [Deltaproteobacteria bacterium]|nr:MAG: GNAT family N-acetyltransferase [Deltaproteobacteria bacterium]